jgi:hypothetical protein
MPLIKGRTSMAPSAGSGAGNSWISSLPGSTKTAALTFLAIAHSFSGELLPLLH